MASLYKDKRGYWFTQFDDKHRKRRSVLLGKVSKRDAETIRLRVERLADAQLNGTVPDPDTSRWLTTIGDKLHNKLVRCNLAETRYTATLGKFIDQYNEQRTDVKASTRKVWRMVHKSLKEHFGIDKPLSAITKGDAAAWRLKIGEKLGDNTVRKRTSIAKTIFNSAVDNGLIDRNPFASLPSTVRENRSRDYFVTPQEAAAVLAKCPDVDWRVIFALCRWGGLRCPSEVLALRWEHILWDQNRFIVESPKTGHRTVPLFPELLAVLNEAWDNPNADKDYVVGKQRDATSNFRTTLTKIIKRAGLKPWPKLFNTLRATRATELADQYPGHVAAAWLGHSPQVANKHYRQVTDSHFEQAAKSVAVCVAEGVESETKTVEPKMPIVVGTDEFERMRLLYTRIVVREGLEPPTKGL